MIEMKKVEPVHDLDALGRNGAMTFGSSTGPHISAADQTAYMVEQFQSKAAIARDIAEHDHEYYFIDEAGKAVGYWNCLNAFRTHLETRTQKHMAKRSHRFTRIACSSRKIYLYAEERGKHYSPSPE